MSLIGERLLGRFRAERLLAARETSETYLGTDETTGQSVAIRVLRLRGAGSWKAVELLEREARALGALEHPGIPRLFAHGHDERDGDVLFILAKAFVAGETLAERIAGGPLPPGDVAAIGARVAEILAYLHARTPPVVHRDVKPANLVLGPDGTVSLIDFGAVVDPARYLEGGGSTIVGTYGFIAPEQVVGDASPASDLYALGATLLCALTARDPAAIPREGLAVAIDKVLAPGPLTRLVAQLLEPDPRRRPKSAEEVRRRLAALTRARPPERNERADAAERWRALRAAWRDETAHDAFVAWCAREGELPFAGRSYREVLESDPEDPFAKRGRERVIAQAQALLAAETRAGPDWKRIAVVARAVTLIACAGLLLWVIWLVATRF